MSARPDNPRDDLTGYELLLGVTGGIAAYKAAALVSTLAQRRCGVTVVMTASAQRLVAPLTFASLSGRRVYTDLWAVEREWQANHVSLASRADLIAIAPATANILAKVATGLADDLLSTVVVSADSPVLLAPAMNPRMWANPITQANVEKLRALGYHVVGPESGWLACREVGPGRMAEPEAILARIADLLRTAPPKASRE